MSSKISLGVGLIALATTIALLQTVVVAKNPVKINQIVYPITDDHFQGTTNSQNRYIVDNVSTQNPHKWIAEHPKIYYDYLNSAADKSLKGDYRGALADYNRALKIDDSEASVYVFRGDLKAARFNDLKGAVADYNKAIQLLPDYGWAYQSRSILKYHKLHDRLGAINDMKQAAKLYKESSSMSLYQGAINFLKEWQ